MKEFPGLLKDFDLDQGWLWVSDKEIHGRHEDGRLLPLCSFLQQQLKYYLNDLNNHRAGLALEIDDAALHIGDILESRKPLLGVFIEQQWQALSPALVAQFTEGMQLEQANWLRHTTRAFLTDRVDETLILALFGHEKHQQEIGNEYSSLALNSYKTLEKSLDEMQAFFQIDGMNENLERI